MKRNFICSLILILVSSVFNLLSAQCADCEDLSCLSCDPAVLAGGFAGTLPTCGYPCPIQSGQPNPLCGNTGSAPNNIFWVPFVASAENLTLEVEVNNCNNGVGLQGGVYDLCSVDDCVAMSDGVCTNSDFELELNDLIPGKVYHVFIDGCSGDVCDFVITIPELEEFLLPDIDAITAFSECEGNLTNNQNDPSNPSNASVSGNCFAASSITVCPGAELEFSLIHQGNGTSPSDHQEACEKYLDNLYADFSWTTSWAGSFTHNPFIDGGGVLPSLVMPDTEGIHTICIESIESACSVVNGPVCLDIHVVFPDTEVYNYDVCVRKLESSSGWDPAEANDDPNGDGLGWLGESVTLEEVDSWPENSAGYNCMTITANSPDCNCVLTQELCILPIGNRTETPVDLFMFRSQFLDCEPMDLLDCAQEAYVWTWDWNLQDEEVELDTLTQSIPLRISGYSLESESWSGDYCDTLISVSVSIIDPPIKLDTLGCGSFSTQFDSLAYYENNSVYENYPPILGDSVIVTYINCNTGQPISGQMNGILQIPPNLSDFCIEMSFWHIDGAWWDPEDQMHTHGSGEAPMIRTQAIYGPYGSSGSHAPSPPSIIGASSFCGSDLTNHIFEIANPVAGSNYLWNSNPSLPGVTITDLSAPGDGSIVSIDLPSGWNSGDCITIVAETACGASNPASLCFEILAAPLVLLNEPFDNICTYGDGDTEVTISADMSPLGDYTYTWNFNGEVTTTTTSSITYSSTVPGLVNVSVSIVDNVSGCSSNVSSSSFEVLAPLASPILSCASVGLDFVEVCWSSIPEANGYEAIIDGVAQTLPSTLNCYIITNLSLNQNVDFSLRATGPAPCFNSAYDVITCTTTSCPPADIVQLVSGEEACENDSPGIFDLNDFFQFSNPNGSLSFSSSPAGLVTADGLFDTDGLAAGNYNISVTYTYDLACQTVYNFSFVVIPASDPGCMTAITDNDGDGSPAEEDCDDNDPNNYPGNSETCDGLDNNCNGQIDEGLSLAYYQDNDNDGYGNINEVITDCAQPSGYVTNSTDCDDSNAAINPGAMDIPNNDIDENCDGVIRVIDNDGDGFNSDEDCDDNNANVFPGNIEECDDLDNNCNGQVDEGSVFRDYFYDGDGDGYGTTAFVVNDCKAPNGYVDNGDDCNDMDASINPAAVDIPNNNIDENCDGVLGIVDNDNDGVSSDEDCDDNDPNNFPGNTEICDGLDNNCDGQADENLTFLDYYLDADGDGYGTQSDIINACASPQGYVADGSDCDDSNASIFPGSEELCDGIDNNCDQQVDEGLPIDIYYLDGDGDGYGDATNFVNDCRQPDGYVTDKTDCNDNTAAINPGAEEIAGNGIDEDCDGADEPSSVFDLNGYRIELYPNPVYDFLYLETELRGLSYSLYSINGETISSGLVQDERVDLSGLGAGVYLIKLSQNNDGTGIFQKISKL